MRFNTAETYRSNEIVGPLDSNTRLSLDRRFARTLNLLCISTAAIPLFMGGFLWDIYALFGSAIGVVFAAQMLNKSCERPRLNSDSASGTVQLGFYAVIAISIINAGILSHTGGMEHPVLGHTSTLLAWRPVFVWLTQAFLLVILFTLLTGQRLPRRESVRIIFRSIAFSSFAVGIIAILHWFSDDGRLFWIFAPEMKFWSSRTRWPFVNSDHLAAFAALTLPILLSMLENSLREPRKRRRKTESTPRRASLSLLPFAPTSEKLRQATVWLIASLSVALALLGSLSRTGWFAGSVAVATYFILVRQKAFNRPASGAHFGPRRRTSHHSRIKSIRLLFDSLLSKGLRSTITFAGLLVPALLLVGILFSGSGAELIRDRIALDTHLLPEDPRWTLYGDAIALLKTSPVIGIGVGQWTLYYPLIADSSLAGARAEYLHSDVLQTLVELGMVGFLVCACTAFFVIAIFLRRIRGLVDQDRRLAAGAFSGLIALGICSAFDFSLRVPGVAMMAILVLAAVVLIVDGADVEKSKGSNP